MRETIRKEKKNIESSLNENENESETDVNHLDRSNNKRIPLSINEQKLGSIFN